MVGVRAGADEAESFIEFSGDLHAGQSVTVYFLIASLAGKGDSGAQKFRTQALASKVRRNIQALHFASSSARAGAKPQFRQRPALATK